MAGYGDRDTLADAPVAGGYGEKDVAVADEATAGPPAAPGFIPTIKRTAGQMLTTAATTAEDITGPNRATGAIRKAGEGIIERNPAGITSLGDIVESPLLAVKEAVGQFVPQIGAAAAGAGAGAALGRRVAGAPGAAIGAGVGSLAPIFTQEYGGIRQDQQEGGEESIPRALAAAGGATALERIGMGKVLKGIRSPSSIGTSTIPREIGKGALREGLTEAAQTGIEQFGAFRDPTTRESVAEQGLAGVMGGIGGGVVGGVHAGVRRALRPAEAPPAQAGDPLRTAKVPEIGPLSAAVNALVEQEAQAADGGAPAPAPVSGALAGVQGGEQIPGAPADASTTPVGDVDSGDTFATQTGGQEQPPAPVFDPQTGEIAQPERATFGTEQEVAEHLRTQRRGGGARQGQAVPMATGDGRFTFVRQGEPGFEQAQQVQQQREADEQMRADTAFEKTKATLPQHLMELSPAHRKLYKLDQALDEAKTPLQTQPISDVAEQGGPAYTPEMATAQAGKFADAVKELDGKLRSGNRTGATTGELVRAWVSRQQARSAIAASRKAEPALWEAYDERQKQVAALKQGDQVLTPYPSPEHPQGSPGVLQRKFGVNWRVLMPQGDTLLVPPTALRPAKTIQEAPKPVPTTQASSEAPIAPAAPAQQPATVTAATTDDAQLDAAAHQAATSHLNDLPAPTGPQLGAGNYQKGHHRLQSIGKDISIETPKGSERVAKDGSWRVPNMPAHYGDIRRTVGADGEAVDLFIGDRGDNGRFWVINQNTPDGKTFDEHKVVTGVDSAAEAVAIYKGSFTRGFGDKVFASITAELTPEQLNAVLPSLKKAKPVAASSPVEKPEVAERRADAAKRKRVAEMSAPEMAAALHTDELTGLHNARWLAEHEADYSHIVAFDADSLKWVNDTLGHDGGDMLLKAWGEALRQASDTAARAGGDEFFALANSQAEAEQIAERVRQALEAAEISAEADGETITIRGLGVSFGVGTSRKAADAQLIEHKRQRQAAGTRAGRGEAPPGTTRTTGRLAQGQQDQVDQDRGQDDRASAQEVDDDAARWTRATQADRLGLLGKSGWSITPPSLSTRRMLRLPWNKMTDGQRTRIGAAMASLGTPLTAAQPAPAVPEQTPGTGDTPAPSTREAPPAKPDLRPGDVVRVTTGPLTGTVRSLIREATDGAPGWVVSDSVSGEKTVVGVEFVRRPDAAPAAKKPVTPQIPNEPGVKYVLPTFATNQQRGAAEQLAINDTVYSTADGTKGALTKFLDAINAMVWWDGARGPTAFPRSQLTKVAPVAAPKPNKLAERRAAEAEAARAAYFTPGNVVKGYGGHDEVLEYRPPKEPGAAWSVRVHRLFRRDSQWVRVGKPQDERVHSTQPEASNLAAGPVLKLPATPGAKVPYTEPRADGQPFANAPDRGAPPAPEPQVEPKAPSADTQANGPAQQLDRPGGPALAGAPAAPVQGAEGGGDTGAGAARGGRGDGAGAGSAAQPGLRPDAGVGDGSGAPPVPARGSGRQRADGDEPRLPRTPRPGAELGRGDDAGREGAAGVNPAPNAGPIEPAQFQPADFRIEDDLALGEGGQKAKFRGNVDAIRLLHDLEAANRLATADEQRTLARYVGWGGLSQAFDPTHKDWTREHAELKALLTPDELATAEESTQYAHYTSREIIGSVYAALARLGFTGGKIVEPGAGVGNFIGLMPEGLRSASRFTGIEREHIAAGIARQLYPRQNIQQADFTEFIGNDGYFDAAIGNPPFAKTALTDQSNRKHLTGLSVHNYFFAKSVDMLRDGGILAQVVSNYFLDARRDNARRYIADRVEFLGAIRLPNNAFAKNAGTEVTTDIVFLKKLPESQWASRTGKENRDQWLDIAMVKDPKGGEDIPVNAYFAANPEMMLGTLGRYGTMYGPDNPALVAKPGQDTNALLRAAIERLPANVYTPPAVANTEALKERTIVALKDATVQEGGHYVSDGKLYQRLQDAAGEARAVELTPDTQWTEKTKLGQNGFDRIVGLAQIRATLRALLAAEMADDKAMDGLRKRLNKQYDAYTAEHGLINDKASVRVFDDDPDFPLIASLEHNFTPSIGLATARTLGVKPLKATATKAPIFSKRVVEQRAAPTRAESPADALNISLAERGRIDAAYIGKLLGKDGEEALREMAQGEKPLLFLDPATEEYTLRDAYLSGNVRAKLEQARQAGSFENARALEAVQPPDVGAHEISVRVGSPWVPTKVYEDFAVHLFGEGTQASIAYVQANSSYSTFLTGGSDVAKTNTWGTKDYSGPELLTSILNNRDIKVTYRDEDKNLRTDVPATEAANLKASEIKQAFQDWAFRDAQRSELLAKTYNETNNNYVTRSFDGGYMNFPGKVPDEVIKFRRHQRNAIARIVQDRTALLDHVVGAGKTFTIVSAAMEMKRTGLANKPMVIVPNHLVKQWATDFYRLYPAANVLTATKKDFEKVNRRKFLAKIATGNWDAVVMAHSSFGFVRPAPEFEARFNEQQIKNIVDTINAVEEQDGDERAKKRTVKQLAALKERLENRIDALRQKPIDALLDFEQIGVDQLFVDEAHLFKNLMFTTKMQNVRGLGDSKGSQRAYDLFIKAHQVYDQNGRGQGVVFATGTPVSNSLAEMYHMMRYLMPEKMRKAGFESFDAWANTFASVEQTWMQKFSGDGFKADNRMSTFVNTPELLKFFDQVADTVTMEDIKGAFREENPGKEFPLPALKTGRRQPVSLTKSPAQEAYMAEIAARAKAIEGKRTNVKGMDNALKIMGDARKAAMDIRLVDFNITEREKGGRIDRAAGEITDRYNQWAHVKGTQLVFSDLGTPIKHAKAEMKQWEAFQERIEKGADPATVSRANLGNEAAMGLVDDAEAAQAELDAMGADWLDAVKAALRGFSVYDDLKAALIERGIPEHQIAFIHDYNTDEQKASLFRKVNAGDIRVLMGSTPKLGAGTNVQERAVAEHHLDVPWKPSDVEQREGRIIRQGNRLQTEVKDFEVEILAYVTQDTLDMRMWQIQEAKLKMINQLRSRQIGREVDNAFEDMEMSAGEMQAAATGNMDLLKEIQLRTDVKKLEQAQRSHDAQRGDLETRRRRADEAVKALPARIEKAKRVAALGAQYDAEKAAHVASFKAIVNGVEYTDAREAGAVLLGLIDARIYTKTGSTDLSPAQFEALTVDERKEWTERAAPLDVELNGKRYTARNALSEAFAELRGDVDPPMWKVDGQTFIRRSKLAPIIGQRVIDAAADQKAADIGAIGPYSVAVEGQPAKLGALRLEVTITADGETQGTLIEASNDGTEDTARKAATYAVNAAMSMASGGAMRVRFLTEDLERAKRTQAELDKVGAMGDWPGEAKLAAARQAHRDVLKRLSAAEAPAAPTGAQAEQAQIDAWQKATGAITPPFSRSSTTAAPMPRAALQREIARITAAWTNAPRIEVIESMADERVPASVRAEDQRQRSQGASGAPEGFYADGAVYLVAPQIGSASDVQRVVLHEALGHFGLRGVYGKQLGAVLDRVATFHAKEVRAKAVQYGLNPESASDLRIAAEEVLADLAQTQPQLGLVRRAVAAIRTWLREAGFNLDLTDDELVRSYLLPARAFVQRGQRFEDTQPAVMFMGDEGPRFSRVAEFANNLRAVKLPAQYQLGDLLDSGGKLSWWHKSVGTMHNLAKRSAPFRRVYEGAQQFINDTSFYATEAADLAPKLLPKLETWRDIGKSPISAADAAAIRAPIFEGTLTWTRDERGNLLRIDEMEQRADGLSSEARAREMLRRGLISEPVLKMWQGLPIEQFEASVATRYANQVLRPGVVFSDAELRELFKLTDGQVGLYQEFRQATDRSLTNMAISDMLRYGGVDVEDLRDKALGLADVDRAAILLRDQLFRMAEDQPDRAAVLNDTANTIVLKGDRARELIERGYAPLSRFGQFTLDVVDADGERLYFGMFETARERSRMARQMRENYPEARIAIGTTSQEDYKMFAGISPETVELFGELLGLEAGGGGAANEAFQTYLKRAKATRSAMKRLIQRKGIAGFSEDAGRVLAGFVVSNARQTSGNLHLGELTDAVEAIPQGQGQLKDAAVNLFQYVRNPQEEAQKIRGLLFAQYLGGSVASAMVNSLQPVQVTFPYLSQYAGVAGAARHMKNAMRDALRGRTGDKALDDALHLAAERGIVSPQEMHQLIGQAAGNATLRSGDGTRAGDLAAKVSNGLSRLQLAWGKVFGVAEQFNRRSTFIAAYRIAVEKGMANPAQFAEQAVNDTQFVYTKANRPKWARGAVGSVLFTFKTYSINYVELLHRMATRGGREGRRAALLALGVLWLMSGMSGLPGSDDLDDLIDGLLQRLGYNFQSKAQRQSFFAETLGLGELGARVLEHGVSALPGVPIDVSGRLGLGNLIPGTRLFTKKQDYGRDVAEIAGPVGDLAKRFFEGGGKLLSGDVVGAAEKVSPMAAQNIIKAINMATTGRYNDDRGKKVLDVELSDAVAKGIGFQPADVARVQRAARTATGMVQLNKLREAEIADAWAKGISEKDNDAIAKARADLATWNRTNSESPIRITMQQLRQRVHTLNLNRAERLERTAPREIRNEVRRQLATATPTP